MTEEPNDSLARIQQRAARLRKIKSCAGFLGLSLVTLLIGALSAILAARLDSSLSSSEADSNRVLIGFLVPMLFFYGLGAIFHWRRLVGAVGLSIVIVALSWGLGSVSDGSDATGLRTTIVRIGTRVFPIHELIPALDPFSLATSELVSPEVEISMDRRKFLAGEAITGKISTFPRVGGDLQVMLIPHPKTASGLEPNDYWSTEQYRFLGRNEEIILSANAPWWKSMNRLISIDATNIPSGEYRLKIVFSKDGCPRLESPSETKFGMTYHCRGWSTSKLSSPIRIQGTKKATDQSIVAGLSRQGWSKARREISKTLGKASTSIRPEHEVVSKRGNLICTKQTYIEPLHGKVTACIDRDGIFGNSRFFSREQTTLGVEGF